MTRSHDLPAGYRLCPLVEEDASAALGIFNEHVETGFAAYPENPATETFILDLMRSAAGYPAFAAKDTVGELVGFGLLRPYSSVRVFAQTAVTTIFLAPEHTGRGIGTAILERMLSEAERSGITRVLAHVSSRNPRSIAFHRRLGFVECGRFPGIGRKWGEAFDVVWMVKSLGNPADA